ncbi:DUF389 domain-containing protein [Chryseobacterium sp.]|uniref:DUF389 domain-containing protein n=1 Tax=Chryseobacterium sp. TaxID=1871047 RepID=UPI0011C7D826|nr:DUF389 domain-containing protein [Chryseobacterium sp.]TXF79569.1 DUF389 domain-containing protein [Chryseobacterium sp.]
MSNFLHNLFNLQDGEGDKQKTLENVKVNISFSGANLWVLACAIIVASVGLNVNSTAVIIGAMLISPLMGPIIGAGFALGMFDFPLLKLSLKNLVISTLVGLIVSALYFFISPFKEAQSEILARISPNIYDVMIAFFGGLVGVIAITRAEKGNPIAGVAIATALMPPLCTAGYGLATGNFRFFFGALFLYTINCVFIGIATFIIVKYLKYPAVKFVDRKEERKVQNIIYFMMIIIIVPSIYFAVSLYKEQSFKQLTEKFIDSEFLQKGNTLIYKKTNYNTSPRKIELAFLQKTYSDAEVKNINKKLREYGLQNTQVIIKQNAANNLQNLRNDILNEVGKTWVNVNSDAKKISNLEAQMAANNFATQQIYTEAAAFAPGLISLGVSNQNIATKDTMVTRTTVVFDANDKFSAADEERLLKWLQARLNNNEVILVRK